MAEKSVTISLTKRLPAIDALRDPAVVCDVAAELWALTLPISSDRIEMTQGGGPASRLAAGQRIVAYELPAGMFDFPPALRRAAQAPPDLDLIAREVAKVIDTRTGYRPPDTAGYTMSIINSLQKRSYPPAVVRLACERLRETDPAEFHHQLPSEAHFIAACDRARSSLEALPDTIERMELAKRQAPDLIEREWFNVLREFLAYGAWDSSLGPSPLMPGCMAPVKWLDMAEAKWAEQGNHPSQMSNRFEIDRRKAGMTGDFATFAART